MSPRPSKAAERKPQLLGAAARVIARRGLTATRLADVAEEAGVSVGTVQHYFGSRERLLLEAFAYETERAVERLLAAGGNGTSAWTRLVAAIDVVTGPRAFRERWTRWLQFWAVYARDPRLRVHMAPVYERWRAPFRSAIEAGIASGEFHPLAPVEDLVDTTVALADGLALQVLLDAPGASLERMRALLLGDLARQLGVSRNGRRASAPSSSHARRSRSEAT